MSLARGKVINRTKTGKISGNTLKSSEKDKETKHRSLSQPPNERDTSNVEKIATRESDLCRTLSTNSIKAVHNTETMSATGKIDTTDNKSNHGDNFKAKKDDTDATSNPLAKKSSGIPLPLKNSAPIKSAPKTPPNIPKINSAKANLKSSTNTSLSSSNNNNSNQARRAMEIQFSSKKRKLEQMKKELNEKQKPVIDMYHTLVTLKKGLDDNGKPVVLGKLKLIEFDEKGKKEQMTGGGEVLAKKINVDPTVVNDMKLTMKQIPLSLMDVCKSIMDKREAIITLLESEPLNDKDTILKQVDLLKKESYIIEKQVEDTFATQEKQITELLESWQKMLNSTNKEDELRKELARQEKTLVDVTADLQKAHSQLKESDDHKELVKAEEEIIMLQEKILKLEGELTSEKQKVQKEKASVNVESKYRALQKQVKDYEMAKTRVDRENDELQTRIRGLEHKIRLSEQKHQREKEELEKRKKQDVLIYNKLSSERQHLETRVAALQEMIENKEKEHDDQVEKLLIDVDEANHKAIKSNEERDVTKSKCDAMQNELVKMEMLNKQATDLVNNRKQFVPYEKENLSTEKEVQLYTELLATKVALKASQDKLEQYAKEKLRFIESIEQLSGNVDKNRQNIAKALLIKEEEISRLINEKYQYEDNISKQKMEIQSLQMSVNNLEERIRALQIEAQKETDQELKKSLQEGRLKLEQALKRSLENEHRLLKFEHDIDQKTKQLNDMENLLKVRDGLIGMIKTKKDELTQENETLNQYAEQVRALLIQAREESTQKNSVIQNLQNNLDKRIKQSQKMEGKIKELEDALSITNEKRYKLQDTIGSMERELQSTKAHVNQMADMQTRARHKFLRPW